MRIVALEEHFNLPSLTKRIPLTILRQRGYPPPEEVPSIVHTPQAKLPDVSTARLDDMDANGITVQVLSLAGPGADLLPGEEGAAFACEANDALARAMEDHPSRYAGFAICRRKSPRRRMNSNAA